jgi:BirA family transcriptional regulator, biotin operon repressor / biotin---[acetyl-CoA-carboxylase] ligase
LPQPLAHNPLGSPFIELQSVDSTNNYALARIHADLAQHGEAFFAREQVAGKGQRGRYWASGKDENIILSLVVQPHRLVLSQQFQLSACISVAVREFFAHYAGDATKIKWPNDLYWQDRKAGGILIENIIRTEMEMVEEGWQQGRPKDRPIIIDHPPSGWNWSVAGIGININQTIFGSGLKNPVSLKQITGKNYDVMALAKELCNILDRRYTELNRDGFENIYAAYTSYLYKKDEPVKLRKDNRVFEAVIKNVSTTGQLIVQHAIEETFDFGEVEWMVGM